MPFDLKNAGATYQRLVNRMFKHQIGKTMEVYVNDLLVKSKELAQHLANLIESFIVLHKYKMKLHPAKCAFRVNSGKFLGFIVLERGIEANTKMINAILNMVPPRSINDAQQLAGRVATLNRFVSRSTDKCLPFFRALRKTHLWNEDCNRAFEELKQYLAKPPLLKQPNLGDIMYPQMEMLAFALVIAVRRLRPYFQAHPVKVLTEHPLGKILQKPDSLGRPVTWSIEPSDFDLDYMPMSAVKRQTLTDFFVEFTNFPANFDVAPPAQPWTVFVDGLAYKKGGSIEIYIIGETGHEHYYMATLAFKTTNNELEYEALIARLTITKTLGANEVEAKFDSHIVMSQVTGAYATKGEELKKYINQVLTICDQFTYFKLEQVPRANNTMANRLAKAASTWEDVKFPLEVQKNVIEVPTIGTM
ncbi:uncharacterized protein LOC121242255 [Juglans microcarpa x Juglans regia]|uniref:uncharacterized protein LOC121242255 n=1 Tax=Juglans microcarpa x Juglans regia TaxID=2249226 RepID=UPI001B7DB2DB|nr:uncharacterized protein LOC121242255 [Juglans microcarpa x Juglans regia]